MTPTNSLEANGQVQVGILFSPGTILKPVVDEAVSDLALSILHSPRDPRRLFILINTMHLHLRTGNTSLDFLLIDCNMALL